ncbi:MAG: hypothetical protein ACLP0J_11005 [Solirubrobacteraceae bacterium]
MHVAIDPHLSGAVDCAEVLVTTLRRAFGQISLDPNGFDRQVLERLEHAASVIRPERPIQIGSAREARDRDRDRCGAGRDLRREDAHGGRLSRDGLPVQHRPPTMLGVLL